jgi:hypothetical protein
MTLPGDRCDAECDATERRIAVLMERRKRQLILLVVPLYGVFAAIILITLLVWR